MKEETPQDETYVSSYDIESDNEYEECEDHVEYLSIFHYNSSEETQVLAIGTIKGDRTREELKETYNETDSEIR